MTERGKVVEVKGNKATVRVVRSGACNGCKACAIGAEGRTHLDVTVENTLAVEEGDTVEIDMSYPDVLKAAFIAYVFPLIMMMGASLLSYYVLFRGKELIAALVGIAFMVISYLLIKVNEKRICDSGKFFPRMVKKYTSLI